MGNHTGQTLAADNSVVAGAVAHSAQTQNETIAAMLKFKTMSNELRKEVNANTVAFGVEQGQSEKGFFDDQANTDRMSGIMTITTGAVDIVGTLGTSAMVGYKDAGVKDEDGNEMSLNKAIDKESATIDECNAENKRLQAAKKAAQPAIHAEDELPADGVALNEHNNSPAAKASAKIEDEIKENNTKLKEAQKQLRSYEERRTNSQQMVRTLVQATSQVGTAVDKLNSASNSEDQAKQKEYEIAAQTAASINQNVWKNFDTLDGTAASEITSFIQSYGQGMVQANTHFRG
jgi:hypothetical protein